MSAEDPGPVEIVAELLSKVSAAGAEPDQVLRRARVSMTWRDFLQGRITRLAPRSFEAIYREAVLTLEHRASEQAGRRPMSETEFALLWHCVITSLTLREAIERLVTLSDLSGGAAGEMSLAATEDTAKFSMDTPGPSPTEGAQLVDMIGLSSFYRMFSWLTDQDLQPLVVCVRGPQPANFRLFGDIFPTAIRFGQDENSLAFPIAMLEAPLVRTAAELRAILPYTPYLRGAPRELTLSERVKRDLRASLSTEDPRLTSQALSAHAATSPSTMRRRLALEGGSVRALRAEVLAATACEYLRQSSMTLDEIAARLGYSDVRAFRRAFLRWTGSSPGAYRDTVRQPVAP